MGVEKKTSFVLTEEALQNIEQKLEALSAKGVTAADKHSGELNFAGCASGYCQAWD